MGDICKSPICSPARTPFWPQSRRPARTRYWLNSPRAAALFKLDERRLFDRLLERERLGSTGIGSGIAIPHARLGARDKPVGLFARLASPVDFDSIDDRPVNLVFLLVAPEGSGEDHLKALALVSRPLRDRALVEKLQATDNADALYALLAEPPHSQQSSNPGHGAMRPV